MDVFHEIKILGAFLYLKHPFYNYFLSRISFSVISDDISSEFGIYSPDYETIVICPKWVEKTINGNVKLLHYHIVHEVLHIAFMHKHRRLTRNHSKWDAACDLVVDNIIGHDPIFSSLCEFPKRSTNIILDEGPKISESVEDLYLRIKIREDDSDKTQPKEGGSCCKSGSCSSKDAKESKNRSNHESWDFSKCEEAKTSCEKKFVEACDFANITSGPEPTFGGTVGETVEILTELRRPRASILAFLNKIVKTYISYSSSFKRGDRRYLHSGLIVPSKIKNRKHFKLLFYVDTSGSVGLDDLSFIFGEVHHILTSLASFDIDVIQSDAGINNISNFTHKAPIDVLDFFHIKGRGGTEFAPLFTHLQENNYDVVITFSDFYISPDDMKGLKKLHDDGICVLNTVASSFSKENVAVLNNVFHIADSIM